MSKTGQRPHRGCPRIGFLHPEIGGASRDRTGDLKLAKLALSQLSYGPLRGGQQSVIRGQELMVLPGQVPDPSYQSLDPGTGGPG